MAGEDKRQAMLDEWRAANPGIAHPLEGAGARYETAHAAEAGFEGMEEMLAASALAELDEGPVNLEGGFIVQYRDELGGKYVVEEPVNGDPVAEFDRDDVGTLAALCEMIDDGRAVPDRAVGLEAPSAEADPYEPVPWEGEVPADALDEVAYDGPVDAFDIVGEDLGMEDLVPGPLAEAEAAAVAQAARVAAAAPAEMDEAVRAFRVGKLSMTTADGIVVGDFGGIDDNYAVDVSSFSDEELRGFYDDVIDGSATWECPDDDVADVLLRRQDMYRDMMTVPEDVREAAGLGNAAPIDVAKAAPSLAADRGAAVPTWFRSKYDPEPAPAPQQQPQGRQRGKHGPYAQPQTQPRQGAHQPAQQPTQPRQGGYGGRQRGGHAQQQQQGGYAGQQQQQQGRGAYRGRGKSSGKPRIGASLAIGGLRPKTETTPDGRKLPSAFHNRSDGRLAVTMPISYQGQRTSGTVLVNKGVDALTIRDRKTPGRDCLMLQPKTVYSVEVGFDAGKQPQGFPVVGQSKDGGRVYVGMGMTGEAVKAAHDAAMSQSFQRQGPQAADRTPVQNQYPLFDAETGGPKDGGAPMDLPM